MSVRCGIDLGTTYSSISWFDPYNNRVDTIDLETADGAKVLRSVVYYPGGGNPVVVGETAWNARQQFPERVIVGIKRSMGTDYKTPAIDGNAYTPAQVSAEILKALARDAQTYLGEEVKDVVITVPAHFGDNERAATMEAGQLAGLNVLALLPEPHAAALAFAVDKVADIVDRYLLVYDLGGGTFDVTLIHASTVRDPGSPIELKIDTLCKDGDAALGGLDWDRVLADVVAEKTMRTFSVDMWSDAKREALLLDVCEKAKRHLSRVAAVPVLVEPPDRQVEVTAAEFEDRSRDLLLQTHLFLERVIRDADTQHHMGKDRIEVMLAGGSSKMPMVKKMVEGVLGRPPLQHKNPELLVTIGAAYWAHLLSGAPIPVPVPQPGGGSKTEEVRVDPKGIIDTAAYAIGVEVLRPGSQGRYELFNSVVLPAGIPYGETKDKEFRTSEDGMTEIHIALYKGDKPDLSQCEHLMAVVISGLPSGRPKGQRVKVRLGYDNNGILRGTALDVATNNQVEFEVDRSRVS
jgi:molecular chaperone DnaK